MIAVLLVPFLMIYYASIASVATSVGLVGGYIAGEVYLWKREMDEEEKEWLHVGLINIVLSIVFLILAITFLMYGYGAGGIMPSILLLAVYCLSGTVFAVLYLRRAQSNSKKGTDRGTVGLIGGAVAGIGGQKYF